MPEPTVEAGATIDMEAWVCPAPLRNSPNIVMGHGGGGAMSAELIEHLFLPAFGPAADAGMGAPSSAAHGATMDTLSATSRITDRFMSSPCAGTQASVP